MGDVMTLTAIAEEIKTQSEFKKNISMTANLSD